MYSLSEQNQPLSHCMLHDSQDCAYLAPPSYAANTQYMAHSKYLRIYGEREDGEKATGLF